MADYNSSYTGVEIDEAVGKALNDIPASATVSNSGVVTFSNSLGTQLFTVQLPLYAGGVT